MCELEKSGVFLSGCPVSSNEVSENQEENESRILTKYANYYTLLIYFLIHNIIRKGIGCLGGINTIKGENEEMDGFICDK